MMAGMSGANISAMAPMMRCKTFWLARAALFTSSLFASSMPDIAMNSL